MYHYKTSQSCKNSYVELILQVCFKNKQSCLKKLRNCLKLKNSKLGKNQKLNFRKTNNLRLMKFLVLICSEAEYIHLKFQVAGTPSLADMVKKPNFGIFQAFFGYFQLENLTQNVYFGLKFCTQLPLVLGNLNAKFGAYSQKCLAIAWPNTLKCPKMANFGPAIFKV